MTIKQLEQLIAINQHKSINRAAEKLFISQPNLSYSLRSLEKEIGFPLFNRTPRGMELTPNGRIVLDNAYTILSLVSSWNELGNTPKEKSILIEGSGIIADFLIPHIISTCHTQKPDIIFKSQENTVAQLIEAPPVEIGNSVILLDFLSTDRLEAAIGTAQKNGWSYRMVQEGSGSVLMNRNAPLADKKHLSVHDFSSFFIAKDKYLEKNYAYNSAADFFQYFNEDKMIITPSRASTFQLVALSENIISIGSFLVEYSSEYISNGSIICRAVEDFSMNSALIAFYHSTYNKLDVEAVLEMIEQIITNLTTPS